MNIRKESDCIYKEVNTHIPDENHHIHQNKGKIGIPLNKAKKIIEELKTRIVFENKISSRAKEEDINRAFSLFNENRKKIIKTKIASNILFN